MARKEIRYKINVSFNDFIKKVIEDADSKIKSFNDKDIVIAKDKEGLEKIIKLKKNIKK